MSTKRTETINLGATPDVTADTPPPTLDFHRLSDRCQRGGFVCGDRDLDKWFQSERSIREHKNHTQRVVTAHEIGDERPIGFYSLTMKLESLQSLSVNPPKRLVAGSSGKQFPSVHLCGLAVLKTAQRRGLGTVIMGRVLQDFYEIVTRTGIFALTLNAVDQKVATFYERLGFQYFGPQHSQPSMLLPSDAVVELIEETSIG